MNISPSNINVLAHDEIFVFGSNEAGRHGAGAAKQAMRWGAKYGQGYGLQGQTFAIPTMDYNIMPLSIEKIAYYVNRFAGDAAEHPELHFLVTEIGCGLGGKTVEEIAPLFEGCKNDHNIYLPERFLK